MDGRLVRVQLSRAGQDCLLEHRGSVDAWHTSTGVTPSTSPSSTRNARWPAQVVQLRAVAAAQRAPQRVGDVLGAEPGQGALGRHPRGGQLVDGGLADELVEPTAQDPARWTPPRRDNAAGQQVAAAK